LTLLLVVADGWPAPSAGPLVAAHRGGALLWPENSLLAFRNALSLGVDFLEADVHLSADGQVIVLHDPTLDRTTTGRGAVRDVRLADLAPLRLRAGDGRATEEPIPTLAQLLAVFGDSRAQLLLEIKIGPGRRRYPEVEEKTLASIRAAGVGERLIVTSFDADTLSRVRALEPTMRTALLVSRSRVERDGVPAATAVRWATEVGAFQLGIEHRSLDAEVVAAARRSGLKVAAWTVNEESDIRRVLALGADVIITDRPDLALRLRGRVE
jgi:glycerophosphoryl diester phosphodiesterase